MLVIDGFREDFVDFDEKTSKVRKMAPEEASYNGRKISVFSELR